MISKKKPEGFTPNFEVSACFCEHEGKVLFLKRHPDKSYGGYWNLPAGKLDPDETPLEAAIREVKEETGIVLTKNQITHVATYYDIYPEYSFLFHTFKASVPSKDVTLKEDEATEYGWFTPENALKLDLIPDENNCIEDAFGI